MSHVETCCELLYQASSALLYFSAFSANAFSALTLLVGRQEACIRPVKSEWWDAGVVICLGRSADLHMAQLLPLPFTVCCFNIILIVT